MKFLSVMLLILASVACSNKKPFDPVVLDSRQSGLADRGMLFDRYNRDQVGGWPDGKRLPPTDNKRVRYDEHVQTYHLGRMPSKDRNSMSEAHRVYQIRQTNRWDLRLPVHPKDSTGVVLGVVEPTKQSLSSDATIKAERKRQAEISRKFSESQIRLGEIEDEARAKVKGLADATGIIASMKKELDKETATRRSLEAELQTSRLEEAAAKAQLEEAQKEKNLRDWEQK